VTTHYDIAEDKNVWRHTSTTPYVFRAWVLDGLNAGATVPLLEGTMFDTYPNACLYFSDRF
jgi:hypothetical protein